MTTIENKQQSHKINTVEILSDTKYLTHSRTIDTTFDLIAWFDY